MLVRETAARELEERRADWGYSKPVVALDILWNMIFVLASLVLLICTIDENPNVPIRVWVCGYAFQCLVHVLLVWLEYRRRRIESGSLSSRHGGSDLEAGENDEFRGRFDFDGNDSDGDDNGGTPMSGASQSR